MLVETSSAMKDEKSFRYACVRIPLVLLLTISPIGMLATVGAVPSAAACTESSVVSQINNTRTGIDSQSAINLAQSASQYLAIATGSTVSFTGVSNGWTINPTSCVVSWQNLAVNFYMKAANGSAYTISVTENPLVGEVSHVSVSPAASAGISVGNGISYSGYGVAGGSSSPPPQLYQAEAYFYMPTVSMPAKDLRTNIHTCDVWRGG
jgi:hypothetical protein